MRRPAAGIGRAGLRVADGIERGMAVFIGLELAEIEISAYVRVRLLACNSDMPCGRVGF